MPLDGSRYGSAFAWRVLSTAISLGAGLWIAYILANRNFRGKEVLGLGKSRFRWGFHPRFSAGTCWS